jgi:hypothetical protein
MKKQWLSGVLLLILALTLAPSEGPAPADKKGGYSVLDAYVSTFREMAMKGSKGVLESNLDNLMGAAVKAKAQGDIDDVFYSRFARLMAVTKLTLVPDTERILRPIAEREIRRFVGDILGDEAAMVQEIGTGRLAESLAQEILNLQLYLDTKDQRKKMLEEFYKKFDAPVKK